MGLSPLEFGSRGKGAICFLALDPKAALAEPPRAPAGAWPVEQWRMLRPKCWQAAAAPGRGSLRRRREVKSSIPVRDRKGNTMNGNRFRNRQATGFFGLIVAVLLAGTASLAQAQRRVLLERCWTGRLVLGQLD